MKDNITIYSPGNIVMVTIDNKMSIIDIDIKDDMFTAEQKPLLEEMIASTINQAYESMALTLGKTSASNSENVKDNNQIPNMDNLDSIKDMFGQDKMKSLMDSINSNIKVEYKDGKPFFSFPMDMIDASSIAKMMELMNNKK